MIEWLIDMLKTPKETFRKVIETDPKYMFWQLVIFTGIATGISSYKLSGIISGPISSLIAVFITGALTCYIGKKLGGNATKWEVYSSMVWSAVALIITIPFSALAIIIPAFEPLADIVYLLTSLYALYVWIVIYADLQGFSKLRAFGNMMIAMFVLTIPFIIIGAIAILMVGPEILDLIIEAGA